MANLVPIYLRNKTEIVSLEEHKNGEYQLRLKLSLQGQDSFILYRSYAIPTEEDKRFRAWINEFKMKYSHLWHNGYIMTSKSTADGKIVFGCEKDRRYIDLATYIPKDKDTEIPPMRIKAKAENIKSDFDLFDSALYGYDGMISHNNSYHGVIRYKRKSKCRLCGCETYKIYVDIHNTGKQDLLEDQPCEEITEENWTNAFDWISIDLMCSNCGKQTKRWFEMETM